MHATPTRSFFRDESQSPRFMIGVDKVMRPSALPQILLVDDDPLFGAVMKRSAASAGAQLIYCQTIEEFGSLKDGDYDVVLMDYDLGAVTGVEMASYMEALGQQEIPVVLVSQSFQRGSKKWPMSIREFIHKGVGPYAILDAAFEAHEIHQFHHRVQQRSETP